MTFCLFVVAVCTWGLCNPERHKGHKGKPKKGREGQRRTPTHLILHGVSVLEVFWELVAADGYWKPTDGRDWCICIGGLLRSRGSTVGCPSSEKE